MQMVKIQIPDKADSARGFAALIRRGRVDCYRDHVHIVPEPALKVLQDMGVVYRELGRGALDYAEKALFICRSSLTIFKATLLERFQQIEIYITSYPIERL